MTLFKFVRIVLLLALLVIVAGSTLLTRARTTDWEQPLWVTVYPINGDAHSGVDRYIENLKEQDFEPINDFMRKELERHGKDLYQPIRFQLSPEVHDLPPEVPLNNNRFEIILWSLKMRWWAWRVKEDDHLAKPDIQLFVLYHDITENIQLERSVGMQKGMYGIVHAFGSRAARNQNHVVMLHELLHTLGATDKYNPINNQPLPDIGLADPSKNPLYPQSQAEIMAGRIALSEDRARMPSSLNSCMIGPMTAGEIGLQ